MWLKPHVRSHSWLIPVWMDEMWQEGGMQTWLGLAWLGWDALPLPLQPPPIPSHPQGAVEDQIRMSSQIGISLIVECLRKMDGYGLRWAGGPSGTLRAYNVRRRQWYKRFDQLHRHHCGDSTKKACYNYGIKSVDLNSFGNTWGNRGDTSSDWNPSTQKRGVMRYLWLIIQNLLQ